MTDFSKIDLNQIRMPTSSSKIYKEECMLCFETPRSYGGLNICLNDFECYCKDHIKLHKQKKGHLVHLNIKMIKKEKKDEEKTEKKPTRLAIGTEDGFDIYKKEEYDTLYTLVCMDPINLIVPLPNNDLPLKINQCIDAVIHATSANKQEDISIWEGDKVKPSKYAETLVQINPDNIKIPKEGWVCKQCDITDNLWMCLTCGNIGCGRRYYDGSGGNNHGSDHYEATGHPLAVKLGTITPEGKADVFSYAENDMVEDPKLAEHLETFGINMSEMKKTVKSMGELELDMNLNFELRRVERSKNDVPVFGPGFTGLRNIGNSCYLASVMQVLFNVEEFKKKYFDPEHKYYLSSNKAPYDDLDVQLAKLANGIWSGKYSVPSEPSKPETITDTKLDETELKEAKIQKESEGIPPESFKSLIGRGHPEFSTKRQQDAHEFFQHVMTQIERLEKLKGSNDDPTQKFKFKIEDRIQCSETGKVRYTYTTDNALCVPVPLESATNLKEYQEYIEKKKKEEQEFEENWKNIQEEAKKKGVEPPKKPQFKSTLEEVRPKVSLIDCIKAWTATQVVKDWYSPAAQKKTSAYKGYKFATFPDYLAIQVRRFVFEGWVPKKLDVYIENPEELDLSTFKGTGKKDNEELLPETKKEAPSVHIDQSIVDTLLSMGFPENRAKKAVYHTQNQGVEVAMNWCFEHAEDPDIDEPLKLPGTDDQTTSTPSAKEEDIVMLTSMGFDREKALLALKNTNNNVERAVDWIFNHMDELEDLLKKEKEGKVEKKEEQLTDGRGTYELFAFICHLGSNTSCGHYVCYIKRDGKWVRFNDNAVEACETVPLDLGYMYFYKRK